MAPRSEPLAGRASRGLQWREALVFLLLLVPSMVLAWFVPHPQSAGFVVSACAAIARDVGLVALIAYFLWRNGEPLSAIGITRRGGRRELFLGLTLFIPLASLTIALGWFLREAGLSGPRAAPTFLEPRAGWETGLAVVLVAVVAIAEETIFRGYLLRRAQAVTGRRWAAVALTSILFAMGHAYEGATGVIVAGSLGLVYALIALGRGSLVAPIALHFLQDLLVVVILPLRAAHG